MPIPGFHSTIDLFCGAGGMTRGFEDVGFMSRLAVDADQASLFSYRANFRGFATLDDVGHLVSAGAVPRASLVYGGPPCQGFSRLNRNASGDERRAMWQPFLDVVRASTAKLFVVENVTAFLGTPEFDQLVADAAAAGFATQAHRLCAADFGVPQVRHRAFVIGYEDRHGLAPRVPEPTHAKSCTAATGLRPWLTVRDAIADLPPPTGTRRRSESAPLDLHYGRSPTPLSLQRYKAVPSGGNRFDIMRDAPHLAPPCWIRRPSGGTDVFGRLWWDRPALTIRTEFHKPEKGRTLHPDQDRPITPRDAARLMGFPDDHAFCGSTVQVARQIGNAVPPPLARAVAHPLIEWLDRVA